jgi:hypothetical protein
MGRQFHIKAPGCDPIIIDLKDNESVTVRISDGPRAFDRPDLPTTFIIDGHRWTDTEFFLLDWSKGEMRLNDSFTVELVEGSSAATPLQKEELYIVPEMHCRFCRKKQSEVRYLIDWSPMASICDKCVETCQQLVDDGKTSKGSDNLIIGSKRAQSLMRRKRKPRKS